MIFILHLIAVSLSHFDWKIPNCRTACSAVGGCQVFIQGKVKTFKLRKQRCNMKKKELVNLLSPVSVNLYEPLLEMEDMIKNMKKER